MSITWSKVVACFVLCVALSSCDQNGTQTSTAPGARPSGASAPQQASLTAAADEQARRDIYLHSPQTLEFFGVVAGKKLLEVEPQSPWLVRAMGGKADYAAAVPMAAADFLIAHKDVPEWTQQNVRSFSPFNPVLGEPASADIVLSVDAVSGWFREKRIEGMFKAMHAVLKPGGTLGVLAPRSPTPVQEGDATGYLAEKQVVFYAELAGFQLVQWSEMNANGRDTRDYPNGASSLPPQLKGGDADRARFEAIGEPDRMTLKFIKK